MGLGTAAASHALLNSDLLRAAINVITDLQLDGSHVDIGGKVHVLQTLQHCFEVTRRGWANQFNRSSGDVKVSAKDGSHGD